MINKMMCKTFVVAVALMAFAGVTNAQLNGVYTIDDSLPTVGGNYATFQDAATDLAAMGVSGPVTFVAIWNTTPYAGFSIPGAITGASAANTITFQNSGGVVISGVAAGFTQTIHLGGTSVTALTGPSYIVIDGFEVTGAPSGAAIMAAGCTNITIRNCVTHTSGAGIAFAATSDSVIEDCEVYGVAGTPGTPGNASYSGGISSYYNAHNVTIQRNRVRDCTGNGIFVGSSGSTTAPLNNIVVNNFVWNTPGLGVYPGGIALRRAGGAVIANNSVWMPATSSFGGIHQMGGSAVDPQPAEISNNIIKHDGNGACYRFESATVTVPAVFDYNVYDPAPSAALGGVGATLYATLAAWQGLVSPNLAASEFASVLAPAGFVSPTDLHLLPGSAAFNSGSPVAAVTVDIDGQARPIAGIPDRGADETPATGLFAAFTATPVSGSAGLTVMFQDSSFSSDPGGVTGWSWDFEDDGIIDSTAQNPTFTYSCPGTYNVRLTVTDASNPSSSLMQANFINVGDQQFGLFTSGGGVGDLIVTPVPTNCGPALGAASGWTLISFATPLPVGAGPLGGLVPDATTWSFLFMPVAAGSIAHFAVTPGLYPDAGPLNLPAGSLVGLTGLTMDAVMLFLDGSGTLIHVSNVARVSF